MKMFKYALTLAAVATTIVAVNTATAGATSAQPTVCDIPKLALGEPTGKKMVEAGGNITATFTVTGSNDCETPVTLAIWKSPALDGQPINSQVFFGSVTDSFGPGTHSLSVKLPDTCFYQADLLVGDKATAPDGTPNYAYQNGQILSVHPLRDFKFGGTKDCTKPEEPKTPEQPIQPEQPGRGGQVQAAVTTTLPVTGPGALVATFTGVTASAGAAHAVVRRLKRK